jgi:hypothetical protein
MVMGRIRRDVSLLRVVLLRGVDAWAEDSGWLAHIQLQIAATQRPPMRRWRRKRMANVLVGGVLTGLGAVKANVNNSSYSIL